MLTQRAIEWLISRVDVRTALRAAVCYALRAIRAAIDAEISALCADAPPPGGDTPAA